jgi:hypothetical protein
MEAPNQIKFQPPVTDIPLANRPKDSAQFSLLLNQANHQYASSSSDYSPDSPKNGVVWLEVNQKTPYGDVKQQLAQLNQPGLLKMSHLKSNDVSFKPIMFEAKNNRNLKHLIIRHSNLHQHQVDLIAKVLKLNDGIAWLVLDHNEIDDNDVKKIGDSLNSKNQIEHMVLSNNKITDDGINHLLDNLPKLNSLQTLWLNNNFVTDKTIHRLMDYVKNNAISTISIENNNLTVESKIKLRQVCEKNNCRCYC